MSASEEDVALAGRLVSVSMALVEIKSALAAIQKRLQRLERGFVAHCDLEHSDDHWCPEHHLRQAWKRTFDESIAAIRTDLAEIDRKRGGG